MLHAAPTPVLSGTNPCFALILFVLARCPSHNGPRLILIAEADRVNTGTSQRMQFKVSGVKVPVKSSHNRLPYGNVLDPDTIVLLLWWAG